MFNNLNVYLSNNLTIMFILIRKNKLENDDFIICKYKEKVLKYSLLQKRKP